MSAIKSCSRIKSLNAQLDCFSQLKCFRFLERLRISLLNHESSLETFKNRNTTYAHQSFQKVQTITNVRKEDLKPPDRLHSILQRQASSCKISLVIYDSKMVPDITFWKDLTSLEIVLRENTLPHTIDLLSKDLTAICALHYTFDSFMSAQILTQLSYYSNLTAIHLKFDEMSKQQYEVLMTSCSFPKGLKHLCFYFKAFIPEDLIVSNLTREDQEGKTTQLLSYPRTPFDDMTSKIREIEHLETLKLIVWLPEDLSRWQTRLVIPFIDTQPCLRHIYIKLFPFRYSYSIDPNHDLDLAALVLALRRSSPVLESLEIIALRASFEDLA